MRAEALPLRQNPIMAPYPVLKLKPKKEISLLRRHPWVFSGALQSHAPLEDGSKVCVADAAGKVMATGHYASGSIALRILDFCGSESRPIDENFYRETLLRAYRWRRSIGLPSESNNAYRLIHGEGDGLPGLVIDCYANQAVVQVHSAGMQADADTISTALKSAVPEIEQIVIRSAAKKPLDGSRNKTEEESSSIFLENGFRFRSLLREGQKTGFFLDQRDNRKLLQHYADGRKVLNAFCYTGGFSIYALAAGAQEVHSLDSSHKAMLQVEEHLSMNELPTEHHRSIEADALKYLHSPEAAAEGYSLIVLDPPAFAKHKSARHRAVQAYKRLNARAFQIAAPNCILFTFSCSQVVSEELFGHTIAAAAMESGRNIRILHRLQQPADHPVSIYHPEGAYLKGLVLAVD